MISLWLIIQEEKAVWEKGLVSKNVLEDGEERDGIGFVY